MTSTNHTDMVTKAAALDKDRAIPLTQGVANGFAVEMNAQFSKPQTASLLDLGEANLLATIINEDKDFPFTATCEGACVKLAGNIEKPSVAPMLKAISDGVTRINKAFVEKTGASETNKVAMAMLFQSAVYSAYCNAGLETGPHTGYYYRGC